MRVVKEVLPRAHSTRIVIFCALGNCSFKRIQACLPGRYHPYLSLPFRGRLQYICYVSSFRRNKKVLPPA